MHLEQEKINRKRPTLSRSALSWRTTLPNFLFQLSKTKVHKCEDEMVRLSLATAQEQLQQQPTLWNNAVHNNKMQCNKTKPDHSSTAVHNPQKTYSSKNRMRTAYPFPVNWHHEINLVDRWRVVTSARCQPGCPTLLPGRSRPSRSHPPPWKPVNGQWVSNLHVKFVGKKGFFAVFFPRHVRYRRGRVLAFRIYRI